MEQRRKILEELWSKKQEDLDREEEERIKEQEEWIKERKKQQEERIKQRKKQQEEWKDLVERKDLREEDLRQMGALTSHGVSKKPRLLPDHVERVLATKCFGVPFEGMAHKVLHNQLVAHHIGMTEASHYSPYCALTQSSGVGKSRALLELSSLGVYVCYCSLASKSTTAFPPRTAWLATKLVETPCSESRMVLYLKAWLHVLATHISTMSPEDWKQQQLPDEQQQLPHDGLAWKVFQEWNRLDNEDRHHSKVQDVWNANVTREAIKSVESALQKKCTQCSSDKEETCVHTPCGVIFAFDEARGLQITDKESNSMIMSPFYQMRRAARIFFQHRTFGVIVLDTSAKVSNLLPSRENEDSERAIKMGFTLAHPIYFLPNMSLFKGTPKVPDCYEPEQWVKQGRPVWHARWVKEGKSINVRKFALQKLVRSVYGVFEGVEVDVYKGLMTESQAMALLSATAGLSICARSELSKTMSASHMHLILRVSEDRSRIYIGLPAEPILAEGAAHALVKSVAQEGALKHLLGACMVGYVTPGPRGEFVAKFILVAATWKEEAEWQLRPISLEKYLQRLLLNGTEDQNTFDELKAKCPEEGTVFFNSFVLVRKPPTIATLLRAFTSGYALMYRAGSSLPGVDMIVPVYTPKGMTCIVVSVKNLQQSGWLEKVSVDKVRAEFTNVQVAPGLVCITIIMSLREPNTKDSDNWVLWEPKQKDAATDTDPYISLTVYGIDHNYTYLTEKVKELLKEVLVTVPDELAGANDQEKRWIEALLPEQYLE